MYTVTMPSPNHKQASQLAKHLLDLGSISGLEATSLYRITSVTKVISVLKNTYNFPIITAFKTDHTGKRYARYHMGNAVVVG